MVGGAEGQSLRLPDSARSSDLAWFLREGLDVAAIRADQDMAHEKVDVIANLESVTITNGTLDVLSIDSIPLRTHSSLCGLDCTFQG